jgi:hypothetical protein
MNRQPRKWHDEELHEDATVDNAEAKSLDDLLQPGQLMIQRQTPPEPDETPIKYAFHKREMDDVPQQHHINIVVQQSAPKLMTGLNGTGVIMMAAFLLFAVFFFTRMETAQSPAPEPRIVVLESVPAIHNQPDTAPARASYPVSVPQMLDAMTVSIRDERRVGELWLNEGIYYLVDKEPSLQLYRCVRPVTQCIPLQQINPQASRRDFFTDEFDLFSDEDHVYVVHTERDRVVATEVRP